MAHPPPPRRGHAHPSGIVVLPVVVAILAIGGSLLLGGRAAEELVFNEISTGAQNDLQQATEIARAMVVEYGMSPRIGPLSFGRDGFRSAEGRPLFRGGHRDMAREEHDAIKAQPLAAADMLRQGERFLGVLYAGAMMADVECPSSIGIRTTLPPRASTTSRPMMASAAQSEPFTRTSGWSAVTISCGV